MVNCIGIGLMTSRYQNVQELKEVLLSEDAHVDLDISNGAVSVKCKIIDEKDVFSTLLEHVIDEALNDSGISQSSYSQKRTGFLLSTSLGDIEVLERNAENQDFHQSDKARLDYQLKKISDKFKINGPCLTVSNTCTSGINAISVAMMWLELGLIDLCIVAGVDLASHFILDGMDVSGVLSKNDSFQAMKKNRDGLILSHGAGSVILVNTKELSGKQNYGSICGWGIGNDAKHIVAPDRYASGINLAIQNAMKLAHVKLCDIDSIFIGVNGTNYNDQMYLTLLNSLLENEQERKPVSSIKHYFGHTLGASVIIEMIGIFLLMKHKCICAGVEESEEDEAFKVLNVVHRLQKCDMNKVLLLSNGFSGINGALILGGDKE